MDDVVLKFMKLSENARAPERGTEHSSGFDVFSAVDMVIEPWEDGKISTDLRLEIPDGWDVEVKNRSGMATKKKLFKGAQLIDSDYRGCVFIHLFNHSNESVEIKKGDKIAQIVMRPVYMGGIIEADISTETKRGEGGFGSTGLL